MKKTDEKREKPFLDEILKAVLFLNDTNGSTKTKITDYVKLNLNNINHLLTENNRIEQNLNKALQSGISHHILKERNGRYRLGESRHVAKYHLNSLNTNKLDNTLKRNIKRRRKSNSKIRPRGKSGPTKKDTKISRRKQHTGNEEEHIKGRKTERRKITKSGRKSKSRTERSKRMKVKRRPTKTRKRKHRNKGAKTTSVAVIEPQSAETANITSINTENPINDEHGCGDERCLCGNSDVKEELEINDENK